ncbi:porimin [Rhinoderma darwinii]|uniref:porimin n=1 Tax=Rhinoderma darwinii TaxID=43563 RepID=UPI003F6620A7
MKLSVDSRRWLWTGLLLLAASYTIKAADNSSVTTAAPDTSKEVPSLSTTLSSTVKETSNSTAPVPTNSSNATSPTPAATPTPATSHTTQGPPVTNASTTTVTSKATVTTPAVTATTSSPVTSSISASLQEKSGFDLGSFIGGIVLTLGILAAVYFGCRFYNSKRGVRYRTIDEHEAII